MGASAAPSSAVTTLTYGVDARSALAISDDVFIINSFSKYFGMTGWRLGWLVAPPGYVRESEAHESGVTETVIVLSGVMEVLTDGAWKRLTVGDAVRFSADRPHGYRNRGTVPVVFHNLIHYRSPGTC